jgi:hypothetical protein
MCRPRTGDPQAAIASKSIDKIAVFMGNAIALAVHCRKRCIAA